jgi:quercetin dioxygenase-like cupin family protein
MGSGASSGISAAVQAASAEELRVALASLTPEMKERLNAALSPPSSIFAFNSGLPDCCTSNPESYTVVAELPNARLIQMKMPPGGEDKPHDHPPHSMYFVTPAKLSITDYPDGKTAGEPHTVEIPAGAAPIFPAGAHQVKNIGDSEAVVIFVEPLPACKPCGDIDGFVTPFCAAPQCYKIHAENDDWITGEMSMEPGASDDLHNHKDHLIYVLEGDELTIYPDGDMEKGNAIPIKPFAAVAAPISAGPIFSKHIVKNTGTTACKMVFFEMKK